MKSILIINLFFFNRICRFSKSIDVEKEVCGLCRGRFAIKLSSEMGKMSARKEQEMNDVFEQLRNVGRKSKENTGSIAASAFATPSRPLNKFAVYVKDNYNLVKRENNLTSHKDVMAELSKNFKLLATK